MKKRFFCIRFDVDTELCLREGARNLAALSGKTHAAFTFFVNPGKAIDRSTLPQTLLRRYGARTQHKAAHLATSRKLGRSEFLHILISNPSALPRHANILKELEAAGHEIGLHGGSNHGAWQSKAAQWTAERVAQEVDWGLERLRRAGMCDIASFASPGWNAPTALFDVLSRRGFTIVADCHGESGIPTLIKVDKTYLTSIPTALTGEPGGVGFFEHARALGRSDADILELLRGRLQGSETFICLYDHPFYAGRHELDLLEKVISLARDTGWTPTTIQDAVAQMSAYHANTFGQSV